MFDLAIGSYVTHAKLIDLGPGEILGVDKGAVRIRFASGERSFSDELVSPHLVTSLEAPQVLPKKRVKRVKKPTA